MPQGKSDQTVVIGVAVAEVRDRNVLLAPIIAAIEFFLSPQLSGSFLGGRCRYGYQKCQVSEAISAHRPSGPEFSASNNRKNSACTTRRTFLADSQSRSRSSVVPASGSYSSPFSFSNSQTRFQSGRAERGAPPQNPTTIHIRLLVGGVPSESRRVF